MNGESSEAAGTRASPESAQEPAESQEIDLQTLAEKVYALMKQELRIEQERQGRPDRR